MSNSSTNNTPTLLEFWESIRADIANRRHWQCTSSDCANNCYSNCPDKMPGCQSSCKKSCWQHCPSACFGHRMEGCITLSNYSRFATRLSTYLPMEIMRITPRNITEALASIQKIGYNGQEYEPATVENYRSFLRTLFRLAQEYGVASNTMKLEESLASSFKAIGRKTNNFATKEEERIFLKKLCRKTNMKPRSLTIWQQETLLKKIRKKIKTDGRYLAIAVILYAGLRPAECRALLWKDIVPFHDHADRHLINIYKTRDDNGNLQNRVKTQNGYRRIPVHRELEILIAERLAFLKEQLPNKNLNHLPVCCLGNSFDTPCMEHHLSSFAMDLFDDLRLSPDDLFPYYVDALLDDQEDISLQHLTLYVLRRNFWTWLASSTQLSDMEKRYVMGHEMIVDRKNLRTQYNDESRLWQIAQFMDHCVLSKSLHEPFLTHSLSLDECTYFSNRGIVRIQVPKQTLMRGGKLHLHLSSEAVGEDIQMRVVEKPKGNFPMSVLVDDLEAKPIPSRINCEYENWLAHQNPSCPTSKVSAEAEKATNDNSDIVHTPEAADILDEN